MNKNKKDFVLRWFEKANNDLKNIKNNLAAKDVPVDTVCFHAQQAIEKYLKGALIYKNKEVSKTHDLVKLLSEVKKFIPELGKLEEELERITEYAVETRYPDTFLEPSLEEAKHSYSLAIKIKKIVISKLKIVP
ncbi:MAG: HEPN domain-containing protein [Elusimicrobia bacterium]|nr:HEPN domain-containing protein [Elusimicrobiota bacterium]MBU2614698.1 HEPN domain-containing protein [Elusimicrobiota bacterium]